LTSPLAQVHVSSSPDNPLAHSARSFVVLEYSKRMLTKKSQQKEVFESMCRIGDDNYNEETARNKWYTGGGRSPRSGFIVYVKSTLTGDESGKVLLEALHSPQFPHHSTANQVRDMTSGNP
jgi:hypothetical protein